MSTLAKLRALHEEVCSAWRRQSEPAISEGEAEIISIGFQLLERYVIAASDGRRFVDCCTEIRPCELSEYLSRVHSQFDDDADIVISGG